MEVSPSKWLLKRYINSLPSSIGSFLVTTARKWDHHRVSSRDQLSRGLELQGMWLTAGRQQVA